MSMIVNAMVMSLIVFRILRVFQEIKSEERILGTTSGGTLRSIIFVLVESGMILFSIQLARLVVAGFVARTNSVDATNTYSLIIGIHEMLNVSI